MKLISVSLLEICIYPNLILVSFPEIYTYLWIVLCHISKYIAIRILFQLHSSEYITIQTSFHPIPRNMQLSESYSVPFLEIYSYMNLISVVFLEIKSRSRSVTVLPPSKMYSCGGVSAPPK